MKNTQWICWTILPMLLQSRIMISRRWNWLGISLWNIWVSFLHIWKSSILDIIWIPFNTLQWWTCAIIGRHGCLHEWLFVFTSSKISTTIEWCEISCTHIYWTVTSSLPTCSWYVCRSSLQAYWLSHAFIPATSVPTFYWSYGFYCLVLFHSRLIWLI